MRGTGGTIIFFNQRDAMNAVGRGIAWFKIQNQFKQCFIFANIFALYLIVCLLLLTFGCPFGFAYIWMFIIMLPVLKILSKISQIKFCQKSPVISRMIIFGIHGIVMYVVLIICSVGIMSRMYDGNDYIQSIYDEFNYRNTNDYWQKIKENTDDFVTFINWFFV